MTTKRTPVYISTPLLPTEADLDKARNFAVMLFAQGCLPIMPFMYQLLFQPSTADYHVMCEELFKGCTEVVSIGVPSEQMARVFAVKGVTPRFV